MGDLGLGQEFHTWHQFSSFFDDWCEKHKVLFIIASLKPLISLRQNPLHYQPSLATTLRFRFVRLICKHSGTYVGQSTVQRNRLSEKIDCPASITLRLGPKKDRLVVIEASLEHNHKLSEVEFAHYFKRHQLEASMGLPIRITNSVSKRFLAPDLIWNLEDYSKAKDKGMCELLSQLDGLFKGDPGAKVKLVFQEDVAVLNSIFLATSHMRGLVQRFPRCLYMDKAACINSEFELYSVLCQDSNGRGRECAYCVARRGVPDLVIFIVASLVQSAPDIKLKVKCLTVGAGITDVDAVEEVLPCARVQICRLQVLEALYRKARELGVPKEDKVRNLLHNMANAGSPRVYSQYLSDLEDVAPLPFLQYYLEHWHHNKGMWAECWAFERNRDCPFLEHMSFHQQKLRSVLSPPLGLAACVRGLLELQVLRVEMAALNEERVSELYRAVCPPDSAALIAEELGLAKHANYHVKEVPEGFLLDGGICSFLVSRDLAACSCSIYVSSRRPCRHLFATRLWTGQPLYDPSLLHPSSGDEEQDTYTEPGFAMGPAEGMGRPLPSGVLASGPWQSQLLCLREKPNPSQAGRAGGAMLYLQPGPQLTSEQPAEVQGLSSQCHPQRENYFLPPSPAKAHLSLCCQSIILGAQVEQAQPPDKMEDDELQEKEFFSWEEFSAFFDAWCEHRKVLFFVKNSVPLSKCKWATAPPQPDVVEALKYSSVRLVCKDFRGSSKLDQGGQQKGCCASIVLKMSPKKDRLIVTECQLAHNHALCPIEFAYYFKKGYLMANSCLPVRTTNKISKQFVGALDVRRLLSYCKSRDHGVLDVLTVLDGLFASDPGAKVKLVFMEDKVIVQTIFFLSSRMMALSRRFPLMLFFDRMVGLNEEFDLYSVLCVDGAGRGHEVAYCLTQRETPDLLRFTLASLVQSVPELKPQVRCVTLGVEIAHLEAVKELLPNARVQICRSQVLEVLFSKAQELGAAEDERIWPLLCQLAAAKSPAAYQQAVQGMKAILPQRFVRYFQRHWQPRSEMWVQFWAFETARNVNACELLKQHQHRLLAALSPSPTVAQCMLDLLAMQVSSEVRELDEGQLATHYRAICKPEPAGLIEEELGFVRHGRYRFQETAEGYLLHDGLSEFTMDRALTHCSCSIYTSSLLPCRHLFATRLHVGLALFDPDLLYRNRAALLSVY
ncbi:uncharacterized protein ZSWIM9 [Carettochelys insculpta]|uniref:uncharacterized protein ZSWIM9 n=1 Tax=Carettochelys insculpta TaxID=44489 RepID=UPI003EB88E2F